MLMDGKSNKKTATSRRNSNGSSPGSATQKSPATRHSMPQIPSLRGKNPRMAVSKASAKEGPLDTNVNFVSMEEVQEQQVEAATVLPTPPSSETMSDESPKTPHTSASSPNGSNKSVSPPTPIKLKIRRSTREQELADSIATEKSEPKESLTKPEKLSETREVESKGQVESEGQEKVQSQSEPQPDVDLGESPPTGVHRTKTKGQMKKSLMKMKGRKAEQTGVDPAQPAAVKAAVPEPSKLPALPGKWKKDVPSDPDAEWLVGDLLMGYVSGHPYWPCMVAYDPFLGIYTRSLRPPSREFHVEFFGQEGERGWIPSKRLVPYSSQEEFEKWCIEMRSKFKKSSKEFKAYMVNPARRKAWEIAMKDASEAVNMNRQDRKHIFTGRYIPKVISPTPAHNTEQAAKKKPQKRKLQTMLDDEDTPKSPSNTTPPKKKQRLSSRPKPAPSTSASGDSDPELSPSHIHIPEGLANQSAAQYIVFCQKKRDALRREHPGYTVQQLDEILAKQWAELDEEQQSKFIPMGSDVKKISQIISKHVANEGSKHQKHKKKLDMSQDADSTKKKRKSVTQTHPMASRMPAAIDTGDAKSDSLADLDDIMSSVAGGAGTVKDLDNPVQQNSKESGLEEKKRKKKSEAGPVLHDFTEEETSSRASSVKEELATVKWKPPKLPGDRGEDDYELEVFRLSSSCRWNKEPICHICEQPGDLIQCEGPCNGTYHLSCLGLTVPPAGSFRCDECGSGRHTCFVCKQSSNTTRRCSVSQCGRYYHENCILKFPLTRIVNNNIICPLHSCATCTAENPRSQKVSKGRMFRCVRCPTAYHVGDWCIAAGSTHLAGLNIVCSRHFQPLKNHSHHSHINVSWCFMCSKGGTLLCCENCPASFHTECLKINPPNTKWYCADCSRGKRPLYGDLVWVKLGNYRWWPGEICQPKHIPRNIQEKAHQVGEFPMRFFGSHDYYWMNQARVFQFQEGDKGSKDTASASTLAKVFSKAVQEATMANKIWKEAKDRKEEQEQVKNEKKPAPYKHIKTNLPIGSVVIYKAEPSQLPRCDCRPMHDNPCGPDSDCLNRLMMYECHPSVCPAGDKCQNQRFTKREYPACEHTKMPGRGWGLRTLVDIKKGSFVNEYVGDLIDEEECKRRIKCAHDNNITNFYMLTLDNKRIIDAGPKGNYSRFMNHSCQPNCVTQKWNVNGDVRVGLFAVEDILAGSELTFNYNLECLGNEKTKCQCGAPNCSGFLGVRPKTTAAMDTEKKIKDKKKKKRKRHPHIVKEYEDDCYRCGEGGELVMCDQTSCPKVYHLKCLKLSKLPTGKWICPWHHCDVCGRRAVKRCTECPNSFCPNHLEENIFVVPEDKLVCADHDDLLKAVEESGLQLIPNDPNLAPSASSSDITSSESSPAHSDGESSTLDISDSGVAIKQEDQIKESESKTCPRTSRTGSGYSDSDMSEGRLCIIEDPDLTLTPDSSFKSPIADCASTPQLTLKSSSNSSKKRGRPKKSDVTTPEDETPCKKYSKVPKTQGLVSPLAGGDMTLDNHTKPPKSNGKTKGNNKKTNGSSAASALISEGGKKPASPMFDDDNSDEFGDLVIDIPSL